MDKYSDKNPTPRVHEAEGENTLKFSGGPQEYAIQRGDTAIGYLIAIYATLVTISTAIVGILPVCVYAKALSTIVIVVALYVIILRTTWGRKFVFREIGRLQQFEEKYRVKK